METKSLETNDLGNSSFKPEFLSLKSEIEGEEKTILDVMACYFQAKEYDKADWRRDVVDALKAYRIQGRTLGDIAYGIDKTSFKNGEIVSRLDGNFILSIKDKSNLAKLVQAYLVFVANKSVQFKDYQDLPSWFDGKIQRFTSQAIDSLQTERKEKQASYEAWLGNIREGYYRDIKNTQRAKNNDKIREVFDSTENSLGGLKLIYTPGTQRLEVHSYRQQANFDMYNGDLKFCVGPKEYIYPISFPLIRDDIEPGIGDHLHEVKINEDKSSANYQTMKQIIKTTNTINLIISEFILHPEKATEKGYERKPFVINGLTGNIDFAKKGFDTNIITKATLDLIKDNFTSVELQDIHITSKQLVDFLNNMFKDVNPEDAANFENRKVKDMKINVDN